MILKNEASTVKAGLVAIFILVGVFGLWIGLAPLSSAAVAVGKVAVVDNKKVIQHLEGGVVEKIYVKDGAVVKEGDPLIEIKNARLKAEIEIVRQDLLQNSLLISRLEAQRDGAKQINFDPGLKKIKGYEEAKKAQENIFKEQNTLIKGELDILNKRISQLREQISGTRAILQAKQSRIKSLDEEQKEWQELYSQQLTDKIRLRDIQREHSNLVGEAAQATADIARLNVQINETESQMLVRQRSFKEEVLKQLEIARVKFSEALERYTALNEQSERTIVKAPVNGTVVELAAHTIGGVIKPGENIMSIVPSDANFIVDAKLGIADIDSVHTGLPADLRFSAFNTKQSHVISGKVTYISADSITDQRGMSYYELKAELTPQGKQDLEQHKFFLLPGMPAEVIVKTGERTVLNYILKPFLDMFQRAFNEE